MMLVSKYGKQAKELKSLDKAAKKAHAINKRKYEKIDIKVIKKNARFKPCG